MIEQRTSSSEAFVVYWLGGEAHCVRSSCIARVVRVPTRKARNGSTMRISYEGRAVDVVDLRERLSIQGAGQGDHILLVKGSEGLVGLIVDRVDAVIRLDSGDFVPPSKLLKGLSHLVGIATYNGKTLMVTDLTSLGETIMMERAARREDGEGSLKSR